MEKRIGVFRQDPQRLIEILSDMKDGREVTILRQVVVTVPLQGEVQRNINDVVISVDFLAELGSTLSERARYLMPNTAAVTPGPEQLSFPV